MDSQLVPEAVQQCCQQQEAWAATDLAQRLRPLHVLRRLMVAECDALCAAVKEDVGKVPAEVLGGEVLPLADACRFLTREAAALLRPRRLSLRSRPLWLWGQRDVVHRRPRGVVGLIGTWNYPLFLNGVQLMQALTAGNGVVWKPSEVAPASARVLFDLLSRCGYPRGLIQLLPTARELGSALLEADIDHVVFTGSVGVGRQIAARLGQRLISSTLELSGCDPMFVLDDADVALAAEAAWFGATLNRGQTCIAVRRAFVHRLHYPDMLRRLQTLAATARPLRLAMPAQARQGERLVADALSKGGRLLAARAESSGDTEFTPAIIADVRPEMELFREASFAPLLGLLPFDDLEQAVRTDRLCPLGLGASVFTARTERGAEMAARLRTGMVTINDAIAPTAHPVTPFGGVGDSGWGVTQGAEGLLEMTVPQVVSVKKGRFRPHYELTTKGPDSQEGLLRGLLRFCHGGGLLERWRGLKQLIRGLRQP